MTKIRPTKRVKLTDEIPADELHLIVFMNRRTIHSFFKDPKTLARYPLTVIIPVLKPKPHKELVNLSAREEFYDRIRAMDPKKIAPKDQGFGSVSLLSD